MDPLQGGRSSLVVGAIYQALLELPPPSPHEEMALATHLDLLDTAACREINPDELARALASQDDDTLSAVAGRPVTRLCMVATGIAY